MRRRPWDQGRDPALLRQRQEHMVVLSVVLGGEPKTRGQALRVLLEEETRTRG